MVQTVQKTVEIYGPDHRDFTVAVHLKSGRCPCCVSRAGSTVACWWRQPRSHSCRASRIPHFMAVAVGKGFFSPVLRAFFALRPLGRRVPALPRLFWSPRWPTVVGRRGSRAVAATLELISTETSSQFTVRTTTTTTTTAGSASSSGAGVEKTAVSHIALVRGCRRGEHV